MEQTTGADRYVVVSSDNHAGGELATYREYLEKKWHEEFDRWAATYVNPWKFVDPESEKHEVAAGLNSAHTPLNWDSDRRLKDLETEGIVAEVIFPNTTPPFAPTHPLAVFPPPENREEYERRWAGLRAHNRWLADFCGETPGRRAGVAQIMLYDVDDAVAEVEALRDLGLTGGILLPPDAPPNGLLPLYYPKYEPLWSVCEALDVPVHRHLFAAGEPMTDETGVGAGPVLVIETRFFANRCLAHLIFAGVFERHPGLKFVFAETNCGWVPELRANLDAVYESGSGEGNVSTRQYLLGPAMAQLSLRPSEYFARNCYLGASLLLRSEIVSRYEIGVDRIMWVADYPHAEGTFPYSRPAYQATFEGVPEPEVRSMLGSVATSVYGFDGDQLQALADSVGPTVEEVDQPMVDGPRFPADTISPVFVPGANAWRYQK